MLTHPVFLLSLKVVLNELHVFHLIFSDHASCLTKVLTGNGLDIDLKYLSLPIFSFNSDVKTSDLEKSLHLCPSLILGKCLNRALLIDNSQLKYCTYYLDLSDFTIIN